MNLIEKTNFRQLENFTSYNQCLAKIKNSQIEEMSNNQHYEEAFWGFLRYVQMQKESDDKYINGNKLIDRIFEIEKFKSFKNQSLKILDFESIIQDEEGVEETAQKVHINTLVTNKSQHIKNLDIDYFFRLCQNK